MLNSPSRISSRKIRYPLILGVISLLFLTSVIPVCAIEWTTRVDRLFRKWDKPDTPGLSLAVIKDGAIIYQKGYGMANLKYDVPLTPSTVLRFGSNSKQFAAFSILLLEDEGLLTIYDDVSTYIPEFPDFGVQITIEHLLYHTSGLRDYLQMMSYGGWNLLGDPVTKDQALAIVSRMKALNFEPGDQFMYSNTGFMLLAEIVARVSGKTFPEFAKERIFDPLGMDSTLFLDNQYLIIKNFAESYGMSETGEYFYFPINFTSVGEGGLHSTVEDLAKWDQNFYEPVVGSHAILERMHQKNRLNDGTYGPMSMGLIVSEYNGREFVSHGGDLGGFHGNLVRFPGERLSIITMSNTFELMSNVLAEKSIQIADYYRNAEASSIPNFFIHEPSLSGWGMSGIPNVALLPYDLRKLIHKDRLAAKTVKAQMTPESAAEYLGRYYCEALDVLYTIDLDDDGNLLFKTFRIQPYLFSARNVRRDKIYINESSELSGEFLRNETDEVIGFQISDPRMLNLKFKKAEIVPYE